MIFHGADNSKITYSSEVNQSHISVYWTVLLFVIISLAILPFIKIDISVKSQGIIRPKDEKTELKSSVSTIIEGIYFEEGDTVNKGDVIIQLRRENIVIQKKMNDFEIKQRNQFIKDLATLTNNTNFNNNTINGLQSSIYKQQTSRFVFQLSELNAQLKK